MEAGSQQLLLQRLVAVKARIRAAALDCGRSAADIRLLAVSKTHPAATLRALALAGHQRAFAESYLQEALTKIAALQDLDLEWHFVGPLQGNKTRPVSEHFHWVHSIDRIKVARRLAEQRPANLPPLQVCLQVNISGETSKSGVRPGDLPELANQVTALPTLQLRGLMAIPQRADGLSAQREAFARLYGLRESLRSDGLSLDTLSMGMSDDMEAAIAEGATMVRVGTGLFGPRQ